MSENGYAKPEALFTADRFKREFGEVEVVGLGRFRMRTLNGEEAARFSAGKISKQGELSRIGLITTNARAVQMVCVDAEGNLLFSEADVPKINQLPAGPLAEFAEACMQFSGLAEGDDDSKN